MSQEHPVSENSEQDQSLNNSGVEGADAPQNQIELMQNELKEKEAKYLYLYAEFENYKKRVFKERSDLVKFGWESVARDLLQVGDNLERALQHAPASTDQNLLKGLQMVHNQFLSTLERQGVQVIPSIGVAFDPNLHEAVGQAPSEDASEAGKIVKEEMKGFTLHGRLLRPARVLVSG